MSRPRHRYDTAGAAERAVSVKAMREQLAKDYNLGVDDPRIVQACTVRLNQQNWEGQIALGRPVPSAELQAYTNVISQLLGAPRVALNVEFVDHSDVCIKCRAPLPPREEPAPVAPAPG